MRKGISMTMTLIVAALVILAAGLTIMTVGQASFGKVKNLIVGSGNTQNIRQIKNSCLRQKSRICQGSTVGWYVNQQNDDDAGGVDAENQLRRWAKTAQYNGKSCWTQAEQKQVFGAQGISAIPKCQTDSLQEFKQCERSVESYCSQSVATKESGGATCCPANACSTTTEPDSGNCGTYSLVELSEGTTESCPDGTADICTGSWSFGGDPSEWTNAIGANQANLRANIPSRCNAYQSQLEERYGSSACSDVS